MVKKILKIAGKVLLVILILFVLLTVGLFISDRVQRKKEVKLLTDSGYLNLVDAGQYRLNVYSYGSDSPKHTLVGISGMGTHNYSVVMHKVTDRFADENKIVFVDRAGYGLSDDTKVKQSVEQVVEDYRTALKNAGFETPYVLLPHSLGGIYTNYWVSKYPDEIEGIVYLDCTTVIGDEVTFEDISAGFPETAFAFLCKLGYQRPTFRLLDELALGLAPEGLEDVNKAINLYRGYSYAMVSEAKYVNESCLNSYNNTVKTDVPKVYISANGALFAAEDFEELVRFMNVLADRIGAKRSSMPEDMDAMLKVGEDYRANYVLPYVESVGNCELKYINGSHMVYYHKPDEVADVIEAFLGKLDKP